MENIKQYPVGSVCIVIGATRSHDMIGKEVTITGPLEARWNSDADIGWYGYSTDAVAESGLPYTPQHKYLKLKQEPPKESSSDEEAFRRFMTHTLMPLAVEQMEEV